jgi:hypothetical protein
MSVQIIYEQPDPVYNRGYVLAITESIRQLTPEELRARHKSPKFRSPILKKVQVGQPPGRWAYTLADSSGYVWMSIKGKKGKEYIEALKTLKFKGGDEARDHMIEGVKNMWETVKDAAETYKPERGFEVVDGRLLTKWQAYLKSKKGSHKTVPEKPRHPRIASIVAELKATK